MTGKPQRLICVAAAGKRSTGRCLVIAACILATTCGCTLPALGGGAPASANVVTPVGASRIVQDYWRINERGAANHDLDTFALVESDLLLEADRGNVQASRALGVPGLASPRPLRKVTVYVPHQRRYPAQFLALLETVRVDEGGQLTSEPAAYYDHFARISDRSRWQADFYAIADLSRPIRFALDADGYASLLAATAEGYVLQPAQVGAALADYLREGLATGTPSGPFAPGRLTTDSFRGQRSYRDAMARKGYMSRIDFTPRSFVQAYRAVTGAAIVLSAIQATNLVTVSDPSTCIVQPPERLQQWGGLVPSGTYASVAIDDLLEFVAQDPRAKPNATIELLSSADDSIAARTMPSPVPGCH
jgi:hypothetical protein